MPESGRWLMNNLPIDVSAACTDLLANEAITSNPAVKKFLENKLLGRTPVLREKGEVNLSAMPVEFQCKMEE